MSDIDKAKMRVEWFKGKDVLFKVDIGRNRILKFNGVIEQLHPSIFTIKANINNSTRIMSYSYGDVMTKVIKFYRPEEINKEILS